MDPSAQLINSLERCSHQIAQLEDKIAQTRQKKDELTAKAEAAQVALNQAASETQASQQGYAGAAAQQQQLEEEVARMREANMRLRKDIADVTDQISELEVEESKDKVAFIEQCAELQRMTLALVAQCDAAMAVASAASAGLTA